MYDPNIQIKLPKGATLVQEDEPKVTLPKGATLITDDQPSKKKVVSPVGGQVGTSAPQLAEESPKIPQLKQLMSFHQEQQTDALRRQPTLIKTVAPEVIKQRNIEDNNKISDAIIKSGGDAERAAFIYGGADETGMAESKAGSIVKNFLNNPNVIQRAQQDPDFKKAYNTAKFNFQNHYPSAAAKDVNQKIGQYMENKGMANGVYNNPSKEKADKAVKEMRQKGILNDRELHLYETQTKPQLGTVNSYLFGSPIPTADFVNEASRSLERQGGNVAEAARDVLHNVSLGAISYPEEQKIAEQQAYATPTVEPKGEGKKLALNIADILGFAAPAILGEAVGIPAMGTMSLQFEGQNRHDAMIKYPNDKTKQDIYTILTTGVDLAAGQKLPLGEAGKAIGGLVDDVVAGKVSQRVAKDKYLNFVKDWGKSTVSGTAALQAMQVGHNAADAALGGKNFNLVEQGKQALEQLPADLVTMAFMGGIAASKHLMGGAAPTMEETSPEQKIVDEANNGNLSPMYNEAVKSNPELAKDALKDYAQQYHGVMANGEDHPAGGAPIANPEVEKAVLQKYPTKESLVSDIKPTEEQGLEDGKGEVTPTKIGQADVSEHGEDVKTAQGKENGIGKSKLTEEGVNQAKELGKYIVDNNQTDIITSEVERGKQTGEEAADEANRIMGIKKGTPMYESNGVKVTTNPLLNTADIGVKDGAKEGTFDEKGWADGTNVPKGAETFQSFTDRMQKAYDYIKTLPETTHVVAHSKVMRALNALEKTDGKWTPETTKEFLKEEGQPTSSGFDEFKNHILDTILNVKDNSFDFRISSSLDYKTREQAVKNIREGKDTKAARTLLAEIKEMHDDGYVYMNTAAGGRSQSIAIPMKEYMAEINRQLKISDLDELNTLLGEDAFNSNFDNAFNYEAERGRAGEETPTTPARTTTESPTAPPSGKSAQPPSQEVQPTPTGEPYDKLVKEHEELIPILESGTPEERKKLAEEQKKELEEYRQKAAAVEGAKEPPPPPTQPKKSLVYFQYPPTQLSHGGVERIAGEHEFEPANKYETSSVLKWNKEADELMDKGFSVQKLLNDVDAGEHVPTPAERVVLTRYAAELQKTLRETNSSNPEYDKALEELQRVANVANFGGSQSGASLGAIGHIKVVPDGSYAEFMLNELAANNNAPLTDLQKKTANEDWNKLDEAQRKLYEDQKAFEQKVAAFRAEQELSQTKKLVSKAKKRSHEDLVKEREDILKNIQDKWKSAGKDILQSGIPYGQQLAAIAPDVLKLARNLVEDGILKLEEVVGNIHGQLKDVVPELTEKDVHDILAGEHTERKATRKEAAIQFENLKQKAALINKLERAKSGRSKTETQEIKKNQDIAQFKKELGIDKLEQLRSLKTRVQSETDKIVDKIKKGDFAPEIKKTPLMEDKELQKMFPKEFKQTQNSLDQYIKAKREIAKRLAQQMYKNKTTEDKAYDVIVKSLNVPRTLMASFDFSAPLRQGIVASIAHPKIASRALKFMLESAKDEKVYNRWLEEVHNSSRWEWASKTDLGITDPESLHLRKTEEAFQGAPYAELIPVIGLGVKASERAYIGFLNKMRWDLFNMYADRFEAMGKTYENNPKLYKGLSSFLNSETGRGGIGIKKLEQMSPVLNTILFASKLIASRLNLLGLTDIPNLAVRAATFGKFGVDYGFYTKLPVELRWEAAKDMAKFIGVGMATLALAKMMGASVEDDPRSSDFGKIHIGNTRWDIWGGFQPYARVITQTLTGQRKTTTTGQIQELGGTGFMAKSRFAPLGTFARQKLAPVPSTIINLAQKTDATGQPVTITNQLLQDVTPLLIQDVYQGMKDQGVKAIFTVGIPSALGVGVQTYQQNKIKPIKTGGGGGASSKFKQKSGQFKKAN